ncbi:secretion system protein [Pseudomonas fluorescens]|uniref:secretion system protein n=1 Tax=Pseudomonas fluorescens TaxID=294 RepID=UPI003526B172
MLCAERLRRILTEPLDYLHPQRLDVPVGFDSPEARRALNQILLEGLGPSDPWLPMPLTAVARQWVGQWRHLPYIARLLGVWRLFPRLAQGGLLQQLPRPLRLFAGCRPAGRSSPPLDPTGVLMHQVQAVGLNSLAGLAECVPAPLFERLPLQFSPDVVDLHAQWPVATADPTLFFLAVQHARLHPNPE